MSRTLAQNTNYLGKDFQMLGFYDEEVTRSRRALRLGTLEIFFLIDNQLFMYHFIWHKKNFQMKVDRLRNIFNSQAFSLKIRVNKNKK